MQWILSDCPACANDSNCSFVTLGLGVTEKPQEDQAGGTPGARPPSSRRAHWAGRGQVRLWGPGSSWSGVPFPRPLPAGVPGDRHALAPPETLPLPPAARSVVTLPESVPPGLGCANMWMELNSLLISHTNYTTTPLVGWMVLSPTSVSPSKSLAPGNVT